MLRVALCVVLSGGMIAAVADQQAPSNTNTASCVFEDGKEMSVRYTPEAKGNNRLPEGKVWAPGGVPMILFTQADLSIENSNIPVGAYSMYVIPQKNNWTLVVNKNVTEGSKYDEHQDLARVPMELGQLSAPVKEFQLAFGHMGPKQCNMRAYYGKAGTWAEFKEK